MVSMEYPEAELADHHRLPDPIRYHHSHRIRFLVAVEDDQLDPVSIGISRNGGYIHELVGIALQVTRGQGRDQVDIQLLLHTLQAVRTVDIEAQQGNLAGCGPIQPDTIIGRIIAEGCQGDSGRAVGVCTGIVRDTNRSDEAEVGLYVYHPARPCSDVALQCLYPKVSLFFSAITPVRVGWWLL